MPMLSQGHFFFFLIGDGLVAQNERRQNLNSPLAQLLEVI